MAYRKKNGDQGIDVFSNSQSDSSFEGKGREVRWQEEQSSACHDGMKGGSQMVGACLMTDACCVMGAYLPVDAAPEIGGVVMLPC